MNNLIFEQTFAFKPPWKQNKDNPNCSGNCPLKIKNLIWINNQSFWVSQCLCCLVYKLEKGKTNSNWGGIYV